MDDGSKSIEERLGDLERAVRTLEARLGGEDMSDFRGQIADASEAAPAPAGFDPVALLTLLGRSLVLLGGAYLLRAITESGVLPVPVGVALGFAYASIWLIAVQRAAVAGRFWSAVCYGATTSVIALPLLFEAVVRFGIIGGAAGASVLTAIALAVLAAAVRARLLPLAWIIVCGSVATSVALTAATGVALPFAIGDIVLGIVTLWIGYTVDWIWLRWLPAFIANVAVIALASGLSNHSTAAPPWAVVAVQLLLFAGYHASIAVRTLVRAREVNLFEALQGTAALAAGFLGAVCVAQTTGAGAAPLIGIGLACAAAAYAVAFAFVARHQGLHRNYYFYTSIALVLVLASATTQPWAPPALAALAVLASWTAARTDHFPLAFHGAIYVISAAAGSGLLATSTGALLGQPAPLSGSPMLILVFGAGCACWAAAPARGPSVASVRLPRLAVALLLTWCAAAAIVAVAATIWSDPGVIATVRTAVLAAASLAVAFLGRRRLFVEAGWLVYPLLVAGGVKLAAEDLPRSRPATLFIALAVYGIALIAAPRIARRPPT